MCSLGGAAALYMYTKDGLPVATADIAAEGGHIDLVYGITAFTQPFSGKTFVYAEENKSGRDLRYEIQNLNTVQRSSAPSSGQLQ